MTRTRIRCNCGNDKFVALFDVIYKKKKFRKEKMICLYWFSCSECSRKMRFKDNETLYLEEEIK